MEDLDPYRQYIHKYFPKMSDATIQFNDLEINYAMRFAANCDKCLGLEHCPNNTKGLKIIPMRVLANGEIVWNFINCQYLGDWRYVPDYKSGGKAG